jgi:hypothetical protein
MHKLRKITGLRIFLQVLVKACIMDDLIFHFFLYFIYYIFLIRYFNENILILVLWIEISKFIKFILYLIINEIHLKIIKNK